MEMELVLAGGKETQENRKIRHIKGGQGGGKERKGKKAYVIIA